MNMQNQEFEYIFRVRRCSSGSSLSVLSVLTETQVQICLRNRPQNEFRFVLSYDNFKIGS
jgi:hypothetical protein